MKLNEFNVIIYNYNERKFEPYNIMEFLNYEYKKLYLEFLFKNMKIK